MHRDRTDAIKNHIGVRPQELKDYPAALGHAYDDIVWLLGQVQFLRRELLFYTSIHRTTASRNVTSRTYIQKVTAIDDGLRHDGP